MSDIIGFAKIITFGTTAKDHPHLTPLQGMLRGNTTGHSALILSFYDQELFDKYIANNTFIPHSIKIDPKTKQKYFEVYVSFWPQTDSGLTTKPSMFVEYEQDLECSAMYTPFTYAEKWLHGTIDANTQDELTAAKLAELIKPLVLEAGELKRVRDLLQKSWQKAPLQLQPLKRTSASTVPILSNFLQTTIQLGPMITIHTSRLEHTFGKATAIVAQHYAKEYKNWRTIMVQSENANVTPATAILLKKLGGLYHKKLMQTEKLLQGLMFPNQNLSHKEFLSRVEPYITFGAPERDSFTIPIVKHLKAEHGSALELEPMLKFVTDVANNPNLYAYNVLKLNCAAVTYNTLWAGAANSTDPQLKKYLALAWYVRLLGLTLTPTMLIKNVTENAGAAIQFRRVIKDAAQNSIPPLEFNPNTFI